MKYSPERGTRILRAAILLSTLYAVLMMLHWPIGFTFFALLSNLFAAAVVLLQLLRGGTGALRQIAKKRQAKIGRNAEVFPPPGEALDFARRPCYSDLRGG